MDLSDLQYRPQLVEHRLIEMQTTIDLYFATGTVYGARGVTRVLKTAALTVGMVVIVLGYRFALLLITLYTT